ncbi:MAG: class I SAM-dependent methyltransferase [Calditrichaeota bacterium]|nr:class I SAM-dependent methyltransferase [Calditrichota bacterium]
MIEVFKKFYKWVVYFKLAIVRKLLIGYYPILLEYPYNPKPRYGWGKPPHPVLYKLIDGKRQQYIETLKSFLQFKDEFQKIALNGNPSPVEASFDNSFLPPLDSLSLYGLVSLKNPKRYFEIGSGNSTKFVRQAIKDHDLKTKITSIDPQPRAEINSICDRIIRQPLEELDLTIFDELESGDILYVDGSHYCFQNSDVTVVFLDVMPRLKWGVIIHIHDIFLPYDYPPTWKERHFSEQYLLAVALLTNDKRYEVMLPNRFISEDAELRSILDPFWDNLDLKGIEPHGGSFWMRVG